MELVAVQPQESADAVGTELSVGDESAHRGSDAEQLGGPVGGQPILPHPQRHRRRHHGVRGGMVGPPLAHLCRLLMRRSTCTSAGVGSFAVRGSLELIYDTTSDGFSLGLVERDLEARGLVP